MIEGPYPRAYARFPEIRQSRLSTFDSCALSSYFEARYRQGWSQEYHARGLAFHRFAAKALAEMARQREDQVEVDVAHAILAEVLRQDDVDRVCPKCGSTDILRGVKGGKRTCSDGHTFETSFLNVPMRVVRELRWMVTKWSIDNTFTIDNLVGVEMRLRAKLTYPHPDGGLVERTLTGQLDALFVEGVEHAIVIDHKTDWYAPPAGQRPDGPLTDNAEPGEDTLSEVGYFQQRFYAWLVMKSFPTVKRVTLREYYVRRGEVREATIEKRNVQEIEDELASLTERFDRAFQERLFTPMPGKHCTFCTRPTACPVPTFDRGDGAITTEEQAKMAAAKLIVAERVVAREKGALKAYTNTHRPVPIPTAKGKMQYGFVESVTRQRPSKEAVEKLMRRGRVTQRDLDRLYPERRQYRFAAHAPVEKQETDEEAELMASLQESIAQARAERGIDAP